MQKRRGFEASLFLSRKQSSIVVKLWRVYKQILFVTRLSPLDYCELFEDAQSPNVRIAVCYELRNAKGLLFLEA